MDAQAIEKSPTDSIAEGLVVFPTPQTTLLASPHPETSETLPEISDNDFVEVVRGALEAVGGTLLFKMKVGGPGEGHHVAAAAVGIGEGRQYLLLTLPVEGGQLKVETVARSTSPLAHIAASYAGLMDVFKAAA
jgi:hypothetical protein